MINTIYKFVPQNDSSSISFSNIFTLINVGKLVLVFILNKNDAFTTSQVPNNGRFTASKSND